MWMEAKRRPGPRSRSHPLVCRTNQVSGYSQEAERSLATRLQPGRGSSAEDGPFRNYGEAQVDSPLADETSGFFFLWKLTTRRLDRRPSACRNAFRIHVTSIAGDVTGEFCTRGNVRETGTKGAGAWHGRSTVQNRSLRSCDRSKSN